MSMQTYRFSLIGGRDTPRHDSVEAESLDHAIWEMAERHGDWIQLYRVNLDNDGLYFSPQYSGSATQ